MKSLAIFGATGSIGTTSLEIFKKNKNKFKLLHLSAHNNYKKLKILQKKFKPDNIILTKREINDFYLLKDRSIISEEELFKNKKKKIDFIISGVSGYPAINFNFKLLKICKNLLIANKETIVCGNTFFLNEANKNNCRIIPIDSEHFCLNYILSSFDVKSDLKKIYVIASGGPFFNKKKHKNYSIKSVLKHPVWKMGRTISVNSSTFANKIIELFEAKILFNLNSDLLGIKVDQTSNTHVMIKLKNGLYLPVMHKPSMQVTISAALGLNHKHFIDFKKLSFKFENPKIKNFPIIKLGYKILKNYSVSGAIIFTVLNERLVNMFLKKEIKYNDISNILIKSFKKKQVIIESKKRISSKKNIMKCISFAEKLIL